MDLTHPADWKTVLPLVGAFVANILLIDWAGWVISGTVLFWGSAWALGSRHYIRDGIICRGPVRADLLRLLPGPRHSAARRPPGRDSLMDVFSSLMDGFATALTPMNFLYAVIGVLLGTAVGVLPGLGPAMTVALLLPVTYALEPTSAFIMFAGIYYGGMYGGSTTSILLNTPGESSSVVTAIEGNKMAKAGRAAQALATAAIGSFVAGTIGTALLAVCAPIVVKFAVSLGSPSYFAIMVLALLAVTAVLGSSRLRGFASLGLGLAIGLVGIDSVTGQRRLTFGQPLLADGLDIVVVAVAIFAVGEALWVAAHLRRTPAAGHPGGPSVDGQDRTGNGPGSPGSAEPRSASPSARFRPAGPRSPRSSPMSRRSASASTPRSSAMAPSRAWPGRKQPTTPPPPAPLTPMLALGLPTNATAAVMLAAFTSYGIQPGPQLFASQGPLVWALIASLFIGNFLLLLINLPLAPLWAKLLQLPAALPLRGDPVLRHAGRLLGEPAGVRPGASCWCSARWGS